MAREKISLEEAKKLSCNISDSDIHVAVKGIAASAEMNSIAKTEALYSRHKQQSEKYSDGKKTGTLDK